MTANQPTMLDRESNECTKKTDYLEWDEYLMAIAYLAARRSKDPCCQVGACIVDKDHVLMGAGYNGMPRGCSDDVFPWGKNSGLGSKFLYVCHAEVNAVINTYSKDLKGCTIYVGLFPCNECAKVIIQSGIVSVVYVSDRNAHKDSTKASKIMFDAAGVKYRQYTPKNEQIIINLRKKTEIYSNKTDLLPSTPPGSPTGTKKQ